MRSFLGLCNMGCWECSADLYMVVFGPWVLLGLVMQESYLSCMCTQKWEPRNSRSFLCFSSSRSTKHEKGFWQVCPSTRPPTRILIQSTGYHIWQKTAHNYGLDNWFAGSRVSQPMLWIARERIASQNNFVPFFSVHLGLYFPCSPKKVTARCWSSKILQHGANVTLIWEMHAEEIAFRRAFHNCQKARHEAAHFHRLEKYMSFFRLFYLIFFLTNLQNHERLGYCGASKCTTTRTVWQGAELLGQMFPLMTMAALTQYGLIL